ncbi:MAG: hypothetical protein NWQ19_08570 [Nonlabens sp.]|nr:hypothetical protein [Nonlabens sp.]
MRFLVIFTAFLFSTVAVAQEFANLKKKRLAVSDSIRIDSVSINARYFKVLDKTGVLVDSTTYTVDFAKSLLVFKNTVAVQRDSIDVVFLPLPDFLTKRYQTYNQSMVLENTSRVEQLVALKKPKETAAYVPFDGLQTTGSITRGLRSGNNQNAVVDSQLDLRITGKLNDKVSLRASIQDANVPQTQNGYAQRLDEFDQIFIELYSDDWSLRAGDVDVQQTGFQFNNFTKRVQGISGQINFNGDDSSGFLRAAGALVRGTFNTSRFTGTEGNQGPYKLVGQRGELFILVVSGSERVYVNGVLLTRGENADYVIDYNAGEVFFNSTFPITSEMRISIEYQFSERNFTRFVGYAAGGFNTEKLQVETYGYTESDAKNQPLQQNLSPEQVAVLAQAGDDPSLATAPSAISDTFSENKILYRKEVIDGVERFVFSQNPMDELFAVRFTLVGANQGNYVIVNNQAIAAIYEYRAPINGVLQGNYEPIIRLFAPEVLTIAGLKATYKPTTSTQLFTEFAASNKDLNKFSNIDDDNNTGIAAKIAIEQELKPRDSLSSLKLRVDTDYIQTDFRNVERVYNIEFSRDWNLVNTNADQLFTTLGLQYVRDSTLQLSYNFQYLEFQDTYAGNKHVVAGNYTSDGWRSRFRGSVLNTSGSVLKSQFTRANAAVEKRFAKNYVGTRLDHEDNQQRDAVTDAFTPLSQKFTSYEFYAGRGDSTATFVEIGYRGRVNDSLRLGNLQRVNRSHNYYTTSQLIKNEFSNLRVFANYRVLKSEDESIEDQLSFNSRVQFQQKLWKSGVLSNTTYETNSASIPRQDFTYVAVNPGQGTFTWIDYNGDGIQDLNEFEVAQFQDQASFVRILLPNQRFLPTHQNKFAQTLTLNPIAWATASGIKKVLASFYNQTAYTIDRMVAREGASFDLNPFAQTDNQLGLNLSFRNSLFFNRGKQKFTTNYTYLSTQTENLQSIGSLESDLETHQITFLHKLGESWLVTVNGQTGFNASVSENFANRNFKIDAQLFRPQISYFFDASNRLDFFYETQNKQNDINDIAMLNQQNLGVTWSFTKAQSFAINGQFKYVKNDFEGQAFSPVGFQMLEGLQPGNNLTWNLLFQKNINSFLDLNLSYSGRNSETAPTVHTGSVQIKAFF